MASVEEEPALQCTTEREKLQREMKLDECRRLRDGHGQCVGTAGESQVLKYISKRAAAAAAGNALRYNIRTEANRQDLNAQFIVDPKGEEEEGLSRKSSDR